MAAGCTQKSPILVRQAELLLSVDFQCFRMAHPEVAHPSQARRVACSHSTSWFDLIVYVRLVWIIGEGTQKLFRRKMKKYIRKLAAWILQRDLVGFCIDDSAHSGWIFGTDWYINFTSKK